MLHFAGYSREELYEMDDVSVFRRFFVAQTMVMEILGRDPSAKSPTRATSVADMPVNPFTGMPNDPGVEESVDSGFLGQSIEGRPPPASVRSSSRRQTRVTTPAPSNRYKFPS